MLRKFLMAGVLLIAIFAVTILIQIQSQKETEPVKRDKPVAVEKLTAKAPPVGDTSQGEHSHADNTFHVEPHTVPVPVKNAPPDTTAHTPPDDYRGDPHYWIPGLRYEEHVASSHPLLPPDIQKQLDEFPSLYWTEGDQLMTKEGPLTHEARDRMELEILEAKLSALDIAKFLTVEMYGKNWDKYAREYAQKVLDKNPDDFEALYIWTKLQTDVDTRIQGFRRLVEINPNSAYALLYLGSELFREAKDQTDIQEGIPYLEKSAALDPNLYQGEAFQDLGLAYRKLGDVDKALMYLNRAQAIHESGYRQEIIRLIKEGELR